MGRYITEHKEPLKFYIDKELKKEFKKYTSDSDMSKVLNAYIESYVKRAKRQEKKRNEVL